MTTSAVPRIVIVGAGFGGLYTARYLAPLVAQGLAEVTLVSRENYFLFTPLLHEVATGGLSPHSITEPVREVLRGTGASFVQAEVTGIDVEARVVATSMGKLGYDYLVVAAGAETNYFGAAGAAEHSLSLKNLSDALSIRCQLIALCERAALTESQEERAKLLSVAVVGGGPTGVELVAEVAEFFQEIIHSYYPQLTGARVTLVSAAPELVPMFPSDLRQIAKVTLERKGVQLRTNARVQAVGDKRIQLEGGETIEAELVIWVAGVKPTSLPFTTGAVSYDRGGRVEVDEYLRLKSQSHVFALGDLAGALDESSKPLPMLAQVAVRQAQTVAQNLAASIKGQPLQAFQYHSRGTLLSLGQWYAAGQIGGVTIKGRLAWWLWRTIYLFNFLSWRKRFRIADEWTINLFYPRDITAVFGKK